MKIYYCDHFVLPLPDDHRFPMAKYSLLRERVVASGLAINHQLLVPDAATDEQLLRAHTREYLESVKSGTLSKAAIRRIGFPWSPQLVERSRRSTGATIAACYTALEDGFGLNLAGGTHHASQETGEGFCVFNDAAVAARALQAEVNGQGNSQVRRIVVLDCDVHQGNGTAAIFADDPTVYTFSIHGVNNFPFHKASSDLDVALEDGVGDGDYLEALSTGLETALRDSRAELAIYLAGADPYHGDRLGRLALTKRGLAERDRTILERCSEAGIPVAVVMSGGYADEVSDIVDIHFQTVQLALEYGSRPNGGSRTS